jgi:sulfur carrier protein ThiS
MRVTFKLFATLQDYLPHEARKTNALSLEITETSTVAGIIEDFNLPENLVKLVLLDGAFVPPADRAGRILHDGETLAIWPPVAGG